MRLDDHLCFALYAATHAMQRAYREPLKALGLTYPQYLALVVLWEEDGLSVSQIGTRLFLDSATLTPLLKRLEAMALLVRKRAAHDERSVLVHLTAKGRALKARAVAIPRTIGCAVQQPEEVLHQLKEVLQTLREELERSVLTVSR